MERRLGSMLLRGAMIAAMAAPLMTQAVQAATAQPKYPLDIAVAYSALRSNIVTSGSFWMQGGSVQVHGQFYRGFGVVADVAGMHTGNMSSTGVELDSGNGHLRSPLYLVAPASEIRTLRPSDGRRSVRLQ